MRYILIFLYFFSVSYVNAQSANFDPNIVINSSIDTTSVKIGEEIIYTIDVISKNKYNISFDEIPYKQTKYAILLHSEDMDWSVLKELLPNSEKIFCLKPKSDLAPFIPSTLQHNFKKVIIGSRQTQVMVNSKLILMPIQMALKLFPKDLILLNLKVLVF